VAGDGNVVMVIQTVPTPELSIVKISRWVVDGYLIKIIFAADVPSGVWSLRK